MPYAAGCCPAQKLHFTGGLVMTCLPNGPRDFSAGWYSVPPEFRVMPEYICQSFVTKRKKLINSLILRLKKYPIPMASILLH
jgi:hypothetical protein